MSQEESGKNYFQTNMEILGFASRKWKLLLGVGVAAAILSAVFSGPKFIPPKFTSRAVVYPTNLGVYGSETELEQLQQYLESNVIRDTIINKFNLYDEYGVDTTQPSSKSFVNKLYAEHVTFTETRFESVEITATSISPQKAKQIVEEVLVQLNLNIRKIQKEKYKEVVLINERLMNDKKVQVDSLENLIREYSTKYGLVDYIGQSIEVTEGYFKFLLSGKKGEDYNKATEIYKNLQKYGRKFHNMHAQLNEFNDEYIRRLHAYEASVKDYNKIQTYTNVLVSPEVPDKKSYPIRWLIVLSAVVASVLFTFTVLLIFGYHKR